MKNLRTLHGFIKTQTLAMEQAIEPYMVTADELAR